MEYSLFPLYALIFMGTFFLTVGFERFLIPRLSSASQPIYEQGPNWHIKKQGTPTMGGLAFLLSVSLNLLICGIILFVTDYKDTAISIILIAFFSVLNASVGILDDVLKLRRKENAGLSPMQKIFLQFLLSILFLMSRRYFFLDETSLSFSFGNMYLGILYYPFSIILLLGIINCANLSDGIDGLASCVAFSIGIVLFFISYSAFTDVAIVSSALIAMAVGFLFFNLNPAKIFMGDTGSLFIGALVASTAFSLKNPSLIIPIGGVYVIEGISVILQVIVFKITKKRIFKMAPLHHHMEKCGFSENKICIIAMIATLLLSLPVLYLIKL